MENLRYIDKYDGRGHPLFELVYGQNAPRILNAQRFVARMEVLFEEIILADAP